MTNKSDFLLLHGKEVREMARNALDKSNEAQLPRVSKQHLLDAHFALLNALRVIETALGEELLG